MKILTLTLNGIAAFFVVMPFLSGTATAQPVSGQSLDRIAAVVGKEIILQSDIDARVSMYAQQTQGVNPDDLSVRAKILDAIINEKLIVAKAIEDSIQVSDEEITQRLDYTIRNLTQTYGSEKRIEDIYGTSIAKLRKEAREDIRKQLLAERLQQQKFSSVKCSPKEIEDFYVNYRDSIPDIPPQVDLYHIVKYVGASADVKNQTLELARKVRDSLKNGGNFADFAKRYSADPGSAASGGELGWTDRGKFVPEYEKAAYDMQPGELSQPVETPFGYHLILTEDKKKDAVLTKHILFKIGRSDSDNDRVKKDLLELKSRAEKGESFEDLARKYSDEKETQGFGGAFGTMELGRLPGELRSIIEKLPDGGISEPLPYASDPTKPAFHIIYRKKLIEKHKPDIASDFKKVEQIATLYKQNRLFEEWIESLRKTMYWEIKK
ncbi:peptidylprolyl isomerase [Ignavibacteria bacterium]|nr:peptidylprolyl isomerase [Bacteroidota bacterium]